MSVMLQSDSFLQHVSPQPVNPRKGYALVEEGNLTTAEAGRRYGVSERTVRRWTEQYLVKLVGALVWDFGVSSQAEDAWLVDEARENPFLKSVQLKHNTAFPGCPRTVRNCMTED
jgi:hypothetical protein